MKQIIQNLPGWPRLLSIPLAAAYLSRSPFFVEELCRNSKIPYLIEDAQSRVIDRLDLDAWIARQKKRTGKLRAPVAVSARVKARKRTGSTVAV
jgi:hypothetical protein